MAETFLGAVGQQTVKSLGRFIRKETGITNPVPSRRQLERYMHSNPVLEYMMQARREEIKLNLTVSNNDYSPIEPLPYQDEEPFIPQEVNSGDPQFDNYVNETRHIAAEGLNKLQTNLNNSVTFLYKQINQTSYQVDNTRRRLNVLTKRTTGIEDQLSRLAKGVSENNRVSQRDVLGRKEEERPYERQKEGKALFAEIEGALENYLEFKFIDKIMKGGSRFLKLLPGALGLGALVAAGVKATLDTWRDPKAMEESKKFGKEMADREKAWWEKNLNINNFLKEQAEKRAKIDAEKKELEEHQKLLKNEWYRKQREKEQMRKYLEDTKKLKEEESKPKKEEKGWFDWFKSPSPEKWLDIYKNNKSSSLPPGFIPAAYSGDEDLPNTLKQTPGLSNRSIIGDEVKIYGQRKISIGSDILEFDINKLELSHNSLRAFHEALFSDIKKSGTTFRPGISAPYFEGMSGQTGTTFRPGIRAPSMNIPSMGMPSIGGGGYRPGRTRSSGVTSSSPYIAGDYDEDTLSRVAAATTEPGGTMLRQGGVEAALRKMHPEYIRRADGAIAELKKAGFTNAGISSGFRPPEYKVNSANSDWSYHSLHGVGLAGDWQGLPKDINSPQYAKAAAILQKHGFHNPYMGNPLEWNHWQLIPEKTAPKAAYEARDRGDYKAMHEASGIPIPEMKKRSPEEQKILSELISRKTRTGSGAFESDAQSNRPHYYGGNIKIGEKSYRFGTGGMGRGSIPYGDYPVTPGEEGPKGKSWGAIGINHNEIWDPKLKSMRGGILFHSGQGLEVNNGSGDQIITEGCIAIAGKEWPAFKAHVMDMIQKHGNVTLHIGPNGASVTPSAEMPTAKRENIGNTGASVVSPNMGTDAAIQKAAKYAGIDVNTMRAIADIESGGRPGSNRDAKTQYKGLYQIGTRGTPDDPSEWDKFGSGDIYNAHDNAMAAARMFKSHRAEYKKVFGVEPTDAQLYMIHQQGLGFYTKGSMTNIEGNPYPGMQGPQTHESFEAGWTARLARGKAKFERQYGKGEGTQPLPEEKATSKMQDVKDYGMEGVYDSAKPAEKPIKTDTSDYGMEGVYDSAKPAETKNTTSAKKADSTSHEINKHPSLRIPGSDFEAQGAHPGSDGYGSKKESVDCSWICSI